MSVFCWKRHPQSLPFTFLPTPTSSKMMRFERRTKNMSSISKDLSEAITSSRGPYKLSISNTKRSHKQYRGCRALIREYLLQLGTSKIPLSFRKKHNIRFLVKISVGMLIRNSVISWWILSPVYLWTRKLLISTRDMRFLAQPNTSWSKKTWTKRTEVKKPATLKPHLVWLKCRQQTWIARPK